MKHSPYRRPLVASASTLAIALTLAPSAGAAPVVKVTVSTAYAVVGFPVTVTLTSTEAGTASLSQVRPDRLLGPGRCLSTAIRYVPATRGPVAAGQKITYKIQPSSLFYAAGDLLPPIGWDNPNYVGYQDLCYDRNSTFNQIRGEVTTPAPSFGYGSDTKALTRIL